MSNLLFFEGGVQGTSLGADRPNQLVTGTSFQPTSQACVVDLTPPVFSGVNFVGRGSLGQIKAIWNAATDASLPIRYEIYVKADTSTDLFNVGNIAIVTTQLQADVFFLPGGTLLQAGTTYFIGVRAIDGVGNRESNIVFFSQLSSGILGITSAQISGVFAVNTQNQLIASFWVTDLEGTISNPLRLGLASYTIYDNSGNVVPGMSESGITADSEGFYEITPVPSTLNLDNTFYTVKVTIAVDGVNITYNLPVTYPEAGPVYEVKSVFSVNVLNQLEGSFWVLKNGEKITSSLGVASFTVRDRTGATVGISQSGIIANAQGMFAITPTIASGILDLNYYTADITIVADGVSRSGVSGIVVGQ
jgi:hypothetical protein